MAPFGRVGELYEEIRRREMREYHDKKQKNGEESLSIARVSLEMMENATFEDDSDQEDFVSEEWSDRRQEIEFIGVKVDEEEN